MRYRVKVEWENEDGDSETAELGQVETGPCLTESDVGLKLVAAQEIMVRLQRVVTTQQLQRHCQAARCCPSCRAPRNVKDYRTRTLDTVLGRLVVEAPRFDSCRACGQKE
jgi:hypothetical protein